MIIMLTIIVVSFLITEFIHEYDTELKNKKYKTINNILISVMGITFITLFSYVFMMGS